ncbi:hypothetical protein E1287_29870 [Actinomadura sp. KC06]|uniref:hypothetical protein n=1 Tax=Actinomadura sp. KC06 TaxID=2530369 RepID=UPI001044A879|nr:hypothetical protein [Actinomadura sp. KC06]TDD30067.1 hypothetical protein E1287_29870 [Actinomadura sp. KC06]
MREPDESDDVAARMLGTLRGYEPPSADTTGFADAAVHAGRRRVRARRTATAAAAAAAVVVTLFAVPLLSRGPSGPPDPVAGRFDPGRHEFQVGSAGGFTPVSYESRRDVQRITLRPERPDGTLRADGLIEMYPEGRLPPGSGGRVPSGRPAPPVHGHAAHVLATPVLRAGAVELAWQWKPGAWGFVSLRGPGADATRAQHVAMSVVPAGTLGSPPATTPSRPPAGTFSRPATAPPATTSSPRATAPPATP